MLSGPYNRPPVSVVVATHNRREQLRIALEKLASLPEQPEIIVVDNGSTDGTADAVTTYEHARVIRLPRNVGAAARNVGVRHAGRPYVAFSDDDSWWSPGSLARAAEIMDAHPRLGLVAARILVGSDEYPDPTCEVMANSPLPSDGLPGPRILGFIACGSVVRRDAFLAVGGYSEALFMGAEEAMLALDLASARWDLSYVDDIVAHHHPGDDPRTGRRRLLARNMLWIAWMRRPMPSAARATVKLLARSLKQEEARRGIREGFLHLPSVIRGRRRIPGDVEKQLRILERRSAPLR